MGPAQNFGVCWDIKGEGASFNNPLISLTPPSFFCNFYFFKNTLIGYINSEVFQNTPMPYEMLMDAEIRKPIDKFAYEFSYPEHEKVSF